MPRLFSSLGSLAERRDGASAVEFALVAPLLLMLILGIVELSMMFAADRILNGATLSAARLGLTGYAEPGTDREAAIRAEIARNVRPLLDPSRLEFEVRTFADFARLGLPEPFDDRNGNGRFDSGESFEDRNGNGRFDRVLGTVGVGRADAVDYYEARYAWTFFTPLVGHLISKDGVVVLQASAVVQNEPY